ncbi:hypothetical protein V6N12_065567 [Hibiscus sabdariffa]|uniref:Uncharacterized protein n=1 Tax=Hibiscus sabdariffa TaxID=183260 RepID=A0ABR2G939_9ROSI
MTKGMSRTETTGPKSCNYLSRTETKGMSRTETKGSVLLCYWLIPTSCNYLSCLYMISLGGKAVTSSLPLSQEYFPHKANCCCIFLAAETLLLPIPRRRLLSAETCIPSRLCVLGLRIGSADHFGPWFDALLVQWCLEKYAYHIALPVVFSLPAEVGVSAVRLLSAETCTPSRLCVLGLRIGSANRFGPWFDALLVQWCLEKYVDHIALPVVFSLLAEVGVSAVVLAIAMLKLLDLRMHWRVFACTALVITVSSDGVVPPLSLGRLLLWLFWAGGTVAEDDPFGRRFPSASWCMFLCSRGLSRGRCVFDLGAAWDICLFELALMFHGCVPVKDILF